MKQITVALSDEQLQQLEAMAARLNVAAEELARVGIEELLRQTDDEFRKVLEYVLTKNAELYKRLA